MVADSDTIRRVIATYHQAAEANLRTAARRENVVHLTRELGSEVLISGDLHGHRLNFNRLQALAELASHDDRHCVVQEACHGGPTYPDGGGCMSHLLLEDIAALKTRFPAQFHFLLGNHELSELTDLLIAKGGRMLNLQFHSGLQTMYGSAALEVREAALSFLRTCPLAVRVDDGIFLCHGSPDCQCPDGWNAAVLSRQPAPGDWLFGGDVYRLLWGRNFSPENADRLAACVQAEVLIHGHEPCSRGFSIPNRRQIILDSCGMNGCCVLLPIGRQLTQADVVNRIRHIYAAQKRARLTPCAIGSGAFPLH
jgi:hypothetical protein